VQAETDYAAARYDYLVSVLQLRFAAGILDRAQLLQINNWLTLTTPTSPGQITPENVLPTTPASPDTPASPPGAAPPATTPPGSTKP
jgi:outer membrane protein